MWRWAQNVETDSLKKALAVETNDEKRVNILESLSYAYLSVVSRYGASVCTSGFTACAKY